MDKARIIANAKAILEDLQDEGEEDNGNIVINIQRKPNSEYRVEISAGKFGGGLTRTYIRLRGTNVIIKRDGQDL